MATDSEQKMKDDFNFLKSIPNMSVSEARRALKSADKQDIERHKAEYAALKDVRWLGQAYSKFEKMQEAEIAYASASANGTDASALEKAFLIEKKNYDAFIAVNITGKTAYVKNENKDYTEVWHTYLNARLYTQTIDTLKDKIRPSTRRRWLGATLLAGAVGVGSLFGLSSSDKEESNAVAEKTPVAVQKAEPVKAPVQKKAEPVQEQEKYSLVGYTLVPRDGETKADYAARFERISSLIVTYNQAEEEAELKKIEPLSLLTEKGLESYTSARSMAAKMSNQTYDANSDAVVMWAKDLKPAQKAEQKAQEKPSVKTVIAENVQQAEAPKTPVQREVNLSESTKEALSVGMEYFECYQQVVTARMYKDKATEQKAVAEMRSLKLIILDKDPVAWASVNNVGRLLVKEARANPQVQFDLQNYSTILLKDYQSRVVAQQLQQRSGMQK